jgi:hypothetical protein
MMGGKFSRALSVAANDQNDSVYQLHSDGGIWRYTGTPIAGWQQIGNNPAAVRIVAGPLAGGLYELDNTGTVWKYTGTPITGWTLLDRNPATTGIVAGDTRDASR